MWKTGLWNISFKYIWKKNENNVSLHEFYLHQIEVILWK